jgi:alpha-amylase/alpha-mannosidase (GH57 family)
MSADKRLNLVICWHMHQPQYCDLISGLYQLPWSYLHATKDYIDMAAHLKAVPGAKAVVNFAPILLEQLSDYAGQVNGPLREQGNPRPPAGVAGLSGAAWQQGPADGTGQRVSAGQ